MNCCRLLALAVVAILSSALANAQQGDADLLIVEFAGCKVGVLEPPGWHGALNESGVAFRRLSETPDHTSPRIQVQVEQKGDKHAVEAFARHMKGYEQDFPNVESIDLDVSHPAYRTTAKLFQVPAKFYEYVVFVNPKKRGPLLLAAAMNTGDHPASAEDLAALNLVVRSLVML